MIAGVAELADALDSKSSDRKIVWVRSPPPAFSCAQGLLHIRGCRERSAFLISSLGLIVSKSTFFPPFLLDKKANKW